MSNTIILKASEMTIQKERSLKASVDITPGMLCVIDGADIKPHAVAGGQAASMFAVENDIVGQGIDTAYDADGENVLLRYCAPGVEVNALLKTGNNVAIGDLLESAGDGSLQAYHSATSGVKASATVAGAATDGGLTFSAKVPGEAGNMIRIVLADAGTGGVVVSGLTITITPDTGANTATAVAAQVAADAGAANLILATAEGTGAGEPGTSAGVNLSGGRNAYPVVRALEAKNNASGSNVRIKAEVL